MVTSVVVPSELRTLSRCGRSESVSPLTVSYFSGTPLLLSYFLLMALDNHRSGVDGDIAAFKRRVGDLCDRVVRAETATRQALQDIVVQQTQRYENVVHHLYTNLVRGLMHGDRPRIQASLFAGCNLLFFGDPRFCVHQKKNQQHPIIHLPPSSWWTQPWVSKMTGATAERLEYGTDGGAA